METQNEKIIQIMPARGWYSVFDADGIEERMPLVAWGLQANGDVVPLDADRDGMVSTVTLHSNFVRLEYGDYPEEKNHELTKEKSQIDSTES